VYADLDTVNRGAVAGRAIGVRVRAAVAKWQHWHQERKAQADDADWADARANDKDFGGVARETRRGGPL